MYKSLILGLVALINCQVVEAQNTGENGLFRDVLLDHMIGSWKLSGTVHEQKFQNVDLTVDWVLNHQYLELHEKGNDTVPWLGIKYESLLYIGYDQPNKRYVATLLNVFGGSNQLGSVLYGTRSGNEIKFKSYFSDPATGKFDVETFTWQPETKSWHWVCYLEKDGKNESPYLDLSINSTTEK